MKPQLREEEEDVAGVKSHVTWKDREMTTSVSYNAAAKRYIGKLVVQLEKEVLKKREDIEAEKHKLSEMHECTP